jgi:hypothetical protein
MPKKHFHTSPVSRKYTARPSFFHLVLLYHSVINKFSTTEKPNFNVVNRVIFRLRTGVKGIFVTIFKRLMHISRVGLTAAFSERRYAYKYIEEAIAIEEKEIYIVGTSFRGLLWPHHGEERVMKLLKEKIARQQCQVYFLLTHPAFAHLRQNLEGIQRKDDFHIAQEILDTVEILRG